MNKRKYRFVIMLLQLVLAVNSISILSQAKDATQFKTVRVACGMNDALYLDEFGDPAGLALPYIRQIAWSAGWTPEYIEGSYTENLQRLYDGDIDIMLPVGADEDPEGKLLYSEFNIGMQQIALFAREDADIYYEDYSSFDGKKIGLSLGGNSEILDRYASEHGFSYTKVTDYATVQDKIDALTDGKVDLIAFSTLNAVPGGKMVAVLDQLPVYLCTNRQNTQLYQELNAAIRKAMINTPDVVSQFYNDMLTGEASVTYTREEHDKIQNAGTVVFGVYHDFLPLAGVNAKGECVGIYVDTLKAIAEKSGLNIQVVPVEDDSKLYSYMDDGTVDFVVSLFDLRFNVENADNYLISNGISTYTTVVVSLPDYQIDESKPVVFALTKPRKYLEEYIFSKFPNALIQYYDTRRECLDAVENGSADASFLNNWEYSYECKNSRYNNMVEWETIRLDSTFAIGATKTSDMEILSILEKTISQLPSDTVMEIVTRNLNMSYDSYTFKDRLYMARNQILMAAILLLSVMVIAGTYAHTRKKYIQDLVVANKAKSDFLSRMSHELRTPLNAISGYASLEKRLVQERNTNPEHQVQYMNSIQGASEYLLGIVKDILNLQQMETGRIQIQKTEIILDEFMDIVAQMIQPMAGEKGIQFSYQQMHGGKDAYLLDKLRLQEVLLSILYNAVKFTPQGGTVTLSCEALCEGTRATLTFKVSDTGIGMSQEFVEKKLYQNFTQENEKITSPYAGVGNSLAVCKQMLELMNGSISCESQLQQGTTFTIVLKTECVKREQRRRERKARPDYHLAGIRVLMCEDNKLNQDMERRLLEHMDCEVDVADDGAVGLKKFEQSEEHYYSIILMDIRMPNMDGLETTRRIRSLERADAGVVPILAVSANAFESDVRASLEAGMNEHLSKPVNVHLLYEKICQYCGRSKDDPAQQEARVTD